MTRQAAFRGLPNFNLILGSATVTRARPWERAAATRYSPNEKKRDHF